MNDPTPAESTKDQLIEHFTTHNQISGKLQYEMSKAILKKPEYAKALKTQSKYSEEQAYQVLINALRQLLKVLPLAQAHRINLSCWLLKLHSDLTGDPTMQEVVEEVNRRVYDKDS